MTLKRTDHHPGDYLNVPSSGLSPPPSPPPRKPCPPVVHLIYSKCCSVALEWARYLDRVYHILSKSRRELVVAHVPVEDLGSIHLPHAGLQVLLLSRPLLNLLARRPQPRLGAFLRPERVLGIMLGVEDALLTPLHREALSSFDQWVHLEAKHNDTAFVHTVINFSIQILQKEEPKINNLDKAAKSNVKRRFQVFPRTLTEKGDASVLLVFQSPLDDEASFNKMDIRVFLRREKMSLPPLPLEKVRLLNPFNLFCVLPACAFTLRSSEALISVEVNGRCLESPITLISAADTFEAALGTFTDPVRVLCTTYGIDPPCKNRLDETLTEAFLSKRSSFLLSASIESIPDEYTEEELQKHKKGEFPTLLHFASHYGFDRLTKTLLDCPAFERALEIRNEWGCSPADLARNSGFPSLAGTLEEASRANQQLHEYSELEESFFSNNTACNYSIPPAPIPVKLRTGKVCGGGSLRPKRASALDVVFEPDRFDHDRYGTMKGNKAISQRLDPPPQEAHVVGKEFKEDLAVADELLKLLDDFQKNSYSFTEMENLFKKWRRRKAENPQEKNKKSSAFRKLFARNNKNNSKSASDQSTTNKEKNNLDSSNSDVCYQTDENELSVVVFPPSPGEKKARETSEDNVSSQILPLSRLSSLSSNSRRSLSPPPPTLEEASKEDSAVGSALSEIKFTPQSMDEEESLLNTPKSLLPAENSSGEPPSNKKQLFPTSSKTTFVPQQLEEYANLPSMIITDFE